MSNTKLRITISATEWCKSTVRRQ